MALVLGTENDELSTKMRGHTGGGLTMGRGLPITASTKQKLYTRSSTKSELVGVDGMMPLFGLAISYYHGNMGLLRTYCCKTTRAPSSVEGLEQ